MNTSTIRAGLIIAVTVIAVAVVPVSAQKKGRRGASESEAILPQIDVIQVRESADEALRAARDLKRENEALSAKIIQLDNRILLLSEELSIISSAKIEELETRLTLLTEAYKDIYIKMHVLEEHAARTVPPPPASAAKPAAPRDNAGFTPATAGDLLLTSPEYDLYQNGLRLFNGRSYAQAARVFAECLAKFPHGAYKDRAQYWIGESLYQQAQMPQAIEAYQKVFAYPNSAMADDAQFKIALAWQKQGKVEQAKAEFRRLIDRYPASEYVERSKKYLEELK